MKKIAIIAAGFGQKQTELTETISLLVSLSEFKAQFKIFSFDLSTPLNHHELFPLDSLNMNDYDALIFPGGLGVATVLSNWSTNKHDMKVEPIIVKNILHCFEASKPIGAICLAPLLLAKVLSQYSPYITLGEHYSNSDIVQKWGAHLEPCPSTDFITDRNTKIITTPAYMNDHVTPYQVFCGIRALTKELVEMA